jgi:hypothetical protein
MKKLFEKLSFVVLLVALVVLLPFGQASTKNMTDSVENAILNCYFNQTNITAPTAIYIGLFTAAPSDTGGGTEVAAGDYARVNCTASFPTASGTGTLSNNADIAFAEAESDWGVVTHIGIFTAATEGTLLWWGALSAQKTINTGDTFKILSGDLDIEVD